MDSKANLYESMMHAISTMGGSHLTQDARTRTAERFVDKIHDGGFTNVCDTSEIKGAELRYYIDERVADGVPTCTIQNEVAYLCAILRAVGKFTVADAPEFSSKALGITGGSRLGTKTAMTEEQLANLVELACHQGKPGIAAVLKLEYYLGLCVNEAIHGCGDTLERWLTELRSTGSVLVRVGTKYGKQRKVISKNVGAATEAVEYALPIAKRQNGFLIDRADGKPSTDLKTAHLLYRSWASRAGVTPNAARYAFARAQVQGYVSEGMSEQEAIWAASLDLGHGDGRSRWQKSVYPFFVRSQSVERIDAFTHDCEAILVPGEGGIGSIFHYIKGRFALHQRVYGVTDFSDSVSGRFLYFYMQVFFGAHAMENSVKATVDSLRLPTFLDFEVRMPPTKNEQNAIVEVLSDIESEVESLESRLSKARDLKQAMAQVLLTGRIRLLENAA